ncbi:MAG: dTDP-4-dehydrorhamnose reductase [Candidatus Kerfeldbacteria bacterium]|nr:dTDP-4-dehydrorhamnose reductase [Candidatus Kerfeldbacteria bacterium]
MRVVLFGAGGMLATALADAYRHDDLTLLAERDCDITKPDQVETALNRIRPSLVINAAAYTNVDGCEEEPDLANAVNGEAVGTIGHGAKRLGATVVHLSTDYVFDGTSPSGYAEDAPVAPLSAYGRSKALGERRLAESGANFYLVRTAWLFGPHGKNFVETMLQLSKKKRSLKVVNDQTGSPTYTRDLADAVHRLVASAAPVGIYHRTNDGAVTWYEFARTIFRLAGRRVDVQPCTTDEFPRPAKRPANAVLQTTKLPPLRPWRDALAAYLTQR